MARNEPEVTPAELRIMKILWRIGTGTVGDVKKLLTTEYDEDPAYTTVMTMMKQLTDKGALIVNKSRQPFIYKPAARKEEVIGRRLKQFLNNVFDGQAGELVLRLVEEADLSPEDLKRIEAKIAAQETKQRDKGKSGRKSGDKEDKS